MLGKLATMGVGMNEGGRVGLANGGNPYAGLNYGYSPVNNIFRPGQAETLGYRCTTGASGPGFQSFQDGLTELPPYQKQVYYLTRCKCYQCLINTTQ